MIFEVLHAMAGNVKPLAFVEIAGVEFHRPRCADRFLERAIELLHDGDVTLCVMGHGYFIVGMMNSAPARMPVGQRMVAVLSRV